MSNLLRLIVRGSIISTRRVNPIRFQRRLITGLEAGALSQVPGFLFGTVTGGILAYGLFTGSKPVEWDKVREAISDLLNSDASMNYEDGSYGPILVRLGWHSSGTYSASDKTGGSVGAGMRFHPESNDDANAGLDKAREVLEPIKKKFPNISYSDLWILASYVAIEEMGGPRISFTPGRKDINDGTNCPPVGRLPDASKGANHIRDVFYRMGFNDQEIVALVGGGHAIGRCHTDRSGFDGPWTYSPTTVSNEYFRLILEDKWTKKQWNGPEQYENRDKKLMMLPADMELVKDQKFLSYTKLYSKDDEQFKKDFAAAFKKLTELGFDGV